MPVSAPPSFEQQVEDEIERIETIIADPNDSLELADLWPLIKLIVNRIRRAERKIKD